MEIFAGHRALFRPLARPAIAFGNFDGVHKGHQVLLSRAIELAGHSDGDSVAFTFEPHPARALAPDRAPALITTPDRKLELLAEQGIDVCVVEPFTTELATLEPVRFLDDIVRATLAPVALVVGYDFSFGHNRAGNAQMMQTFGQTHGIAVHVIDPVSVDGTVASSTAIRNLVGEGNLAHAKRLLGRDFELEGVVVQGQGRGRTIGIPTANVQLRTQLVPARGVYAVRTKMQQGLTQSYHLGVANWGTKPTFCDDDIPILEVHLFDFTGDLYGASARVELVERLRGQTKFSGPAELVAQIQRDIAQARELLRS